MKRQIEIKGEKQQKTKDKTTLKYASHINNHLNANNLNSFIVQWIKKG